jgi:hypothetical protein
LARWSGLLDLSNGLLDLAADGLLDLAAHGLLDLAA